MSKQQFVAAFAAGVVAVVLGCDVEPEAEDLDPSELEAEDEVEATLEIVENLRLAGYPAAEIDVRDDGTVIAGGDAVVSLAASREMIGQGAEDEGDGKVGFRQYRTNNLVSLTVDTICVDGSEFADTYGTALDNAIANYTDLSLSFDMVRTTGWVVGCDALITANLFDGTGGISGFPAGGLPYDTINIGDDNPAHVGLLTHLITHELGHCIGFRHTDYFDRASCGEPLENEGEGEVGAVHIPGTPTGATTSIMNSCGAKLWSTGQWTDTDVAALNALYPYWGPPSPDPLTKYSNQCYGSHDIEWGTSTGATSYQLYGSTSYSFTSPFLLYSGPNTYKLINVSSGTWYLRAMACDAVGCGPWTNQVSATRINGCL